MLSTAFFRSVLVGATFAFAIATPIFSSEVAEGPIASFVVGKDGRVLLVPVSLRGQSVPFLVDTGAARTVFDNTLRGQLGPQIGQISLRTSAGIVSLDSFECPDAMLGPFNLKSNSAVVCTELTSIRNATGHQIYGVLGMDFLHHFAMEVNFDEGTLHLWKAAPSHWRQEGERLSLNPLDGCPSITVTLPDHSLEPFLLDTGANACCVRQDAYDRLVDLGALTVRTPYRAFCAGGAVQGQSGYVSQLAVGRFIHLHVRLDRDSMSLLGLRYLSRFTVRFDFPNKVAYFAQGRRYAEPERVATSGMSVLEIGGQKIVYAVEQVGAAADAGIEPGDLIVTIDGQPAAMHDLFSLGQLLTSDVGKSVSLRLRRQDVEFPIVLTLRSAIQSN